VSSSGVYIVMATLNGASWLPEQLASIQSQGHRQWTLLVSDDGSTDGTIDIVRRAASEDKRIQLLPFRGGSAGHVANFEYLLEHALQQGAGVVFLADQDDVWQPQKLAVLLAIADANNGLPMAAFSNMELIDSHGNSLGSFLDTVNFNEKFGVDELLRQNYLAGCSMLVNAELLKLALPFPDNLENHDWWLGMCAAAVGHLAFSPEKLLRYRQHSGNTIGSGAVYTQVSNLWPILKRQRRVFEARLVAVMELTRRLRETGAAVPASLQAYESQLGDAKGWRKPLALASSKYKPRSRALYLIQLLALSPMVKGD